MLRLTSACTKQEVELGSDGRFVEASEDIQLRREPQQVYGWVEQLLIRQEYPSRQGGAWPGAALHREDDGAEPFAGDAADRRYTATGRVRPTVYRRRRFPDRYTRADVELLARSMSARDLERSGNAAHSGARTSALRQAEVRAIGCHLRGSSVQPAQEPPLSRTASQLHQDAAHAVSIGERRKPQPQGQPGYLRLDTVHQGDQPEAKGSITSTPSMRFCSGRWWVRHRVFPSLSEASAGEHAAPVPVSHPRLPHRQRLGVHQRTVAELLEKLLIEQTKSRPRQSGDNGLVETKTAR